MNDSPESGKVHNERRGVIESNDLHVDVYK